MSIKHKKVQVGEQKKLSTLDIKLDWLASLVTDPSLAHSTLCQRQLYTVEEDHELMTYFNWTIAFVLKNPLLKRA